MAHTHYLALTLCVLLLPACRSNPNTALETGSYHSWEGESLPYLIIDHKLGMGAELSEWVSWYIYDGIQGVESLPQYQGRYVFVDTLSGTNMDALNQWLENYRTIQDFNLLVSARVQERFVLGAGGNVDAVYGRFYEQAIRGVTDALYRDVLREDDYWLLKQYLPGEEEEAKEDEYTMLLLISIDRRSLETQLLGILTAYQSSGRPSRDQGTAISRLIDTFFQGGRF